MANGCYNLPLWVLLGGNISQLLMIANSSINFFIYAFMSTIFREVLVEHSAHYMRLCCGPLMKIIESNGKLTLFNYSLSTFFPSTYGNTSSNQTPAVIVLFIILGLCVPRETSSNEEDNELMEVNDNKTFTVITEANSRSHLGQSNINAKTQTSPAAVVTV